MCLSRSLLNATVVSVCPTTPDNAFYTLTTHCVKKTIFKLAPLISFKLCSHLKLSCGFFLTTLSTCVSTYRELQTWTPRYLCISMLLRIMPFPPYICPDKDNTSHLLGLNSICHFSAHFCSWSISRCMLWQASSQSMTTICKLTSQPVYIYVQVMEEQGLRAIWPSVFFVHDISIW